jgi:hypothetical protein
MTLTGTLLHRAIGGIGGRSRFVARSVLAFCVCVWLVAANADAQTSGLGAITGTVTDPAGAVVVGAKLQVTNVATNIKQDSVANGVGYFEVDSLIPGTYRVTASAPGFETLLRDGITLDAGAIENVPLQLHTGAVSQTVTIFGDATLLNTEDGSSGQVLTTRQLEALPSSGSNPAWFIELAPAVQSPFSQTLSTDGTLNWNGVSNFSTFGQQQKSEYSLDGAPNMQNRSNGVNLTEDELSEMRLDVTGFDPSVGHSIGAAVTQTTKNGTNQFHGAIRENYEDKRWSAMGHFQGLNYKYQEKISGCNGSHSSPACLKIENQYGWPGVHENNANFSVGGPISIPKLFSGRERLFFFASVLDDVFSGTGTGNVFIPTVQERSGNFNDLPVQTTNVPAAFTAACGSLTPYYGQYQIYDPYSTTLDSSGIPRRTPICGNVLPANRLLNGTMATLYNGLLPTPTQNNPTGNNYTYSQIRPQTYRDYTGRVDWEVTQSDHAYFRYTRANYVNDSSGFTVGNKDQNEGPRWIDTAAIGWSHVFSPKTSLETTVGGTNFNTKCCYYPGYDAYSPSSVGLPGYAASLAGSNHTLPVLAVSNYAQIGQTDNTNQYFRSLAFRANLTHVLRNHTLRAGGEYRLQNFSQGIQGNTSGTYNFDNTYTQENNGSDPTFSQTNTGLSYAAFLMGVQSQASASSQAPISIHTPYYALFVGDTWRVSSKLTVIPGIRFEWEAGPVEKHNNQIVGWDPNASLPISAAANAAYQAAVSSATLTSAQRAALPASLTIQGGPLYAGVNGAPTSEWNNSYRFLPRLAISYQLKPNTVVRAGFGLFYDTLNALVSNIDQDGFSSSTSAPSSTAFGTNFTAGTPPISNPFPAGSNGSHFNSPVGSSAGSMFYAANGQSPTITDHSLSPSRQYRGYIGVQHQFGGSTMLEVAWYGALTTNIQMSQNYTYTPSSFYAGGLQPNSAPAAVLNAQIANPFALANFSGLQSSNPAAYNLMSLNSHYTAKTIPLSTLVRAYPQMNGLSLNRPIGETKYQLLQITANRRYSQGLTLMGSLQLTKDQNRDYFANGFDPTPSWEATNTAVPVRLTAEGVYSLPFGRGKMWADSGWKSAAFGGLQLSASLEAETGQLIGFNNAFYVGQLNGSDIKLKNPVYVNGQATGGSNYIQWLTAGTAVATPNVDSQGNFLGTCSYTGTGFVTNSQCQPTGNNLRVFPRTVKGVRNLGWDSTNANLQRTFPIVKEKLTLDTRFEVYNLFNHLGLGGPNTNPTDPNFGKINGDNQPNGRWINISGHLRF